METETEEISGQTQGDEGGGGARGRCGVVTMEKLLLSPESQGQPVKRGEP